MNFDWTNLFQGELSGYGLEEWLIIGVGVLLLVIILFLIFKPKKDKKVTYKEVQAAPKPAEAKPTESMEPSKPVESKVEPKAEVKDEPKEPPTPKTTPAKKEAAPEKAEAATEKAQRYHVSLNKDAKSEFKGQWRVRKEGSKKTIKYFKTQVEAIKYAEELAENNDTSIVIHKRDGSIRKQDYTKSSK